MHGKGKMGKVMRAIGLMSGTSLDGIDIAYVETDGEDIVNRGPATTVAYAPEVRQLLREALEAAQGLNARDERPGALHLAEAQLTRLHGAAVMAFMRKYGIPRTSVDVIGFHGQTVLHRPEAGITVQIGRGDVLADVTRCPVVFDMRAADIAAGGQGAPLAPAYHRALAAELPQRPIAVVNIGGVANITWIGCDGRLIAFDTGPGSAAIDDLMARRAGQAFDEGGATADRGRVHEDLVHACLSAPYFAAPPPKSLDRNAFTSAIVDGLSLEDGAATLAALTAQALIKAREHLPEEPELWVVSGGGRRNRAIMRMLAGGVTGAVVPAEAAGFGGDSIEAEAWAYLAVRSLKGLPITFPGTTGVAEPLAGGIRADPRVDRMH